MKLPILLTVAALVLGSQFATANASAADYRNEMTTEQTQILHDQVGADDCLNACIATVLQLPRYDRAVIPDFGIPNEEPASLTRYWDRMSHWLNENELALIEVAFKGAGSFWSPYYNDVGLFIASGDSPRHGPDSDRKHAVVYGLGPDRYYEMIHDPHPSRDGILGEPRNALFVFHKGGPRQHDSLIC